MKSRISTKCLTFTGIPHEHLIVNALHVLHMPHALLTIAQLVEHKSLPIVLISSYGDKECHMSNAISLPFLLSCHLTLYYLYEPRPLQLASLTVFKYLIVMNF